jgi:hypothetical protein
MNRTICTDEAFHYTDTIGLNGRSKQVLNMQRHRSSNHSLRAHHKMQLRMSVRHSEMHARFQIVELSIGTSMLGDFCVRLPDMVTSLAVINMIIAGHIHSKRILVQDMQGGNIK